MGSDSVKPPVGFVVDPPAGFVEDVPSATAIATPPAAKTEHPWLDKLDYVAAGLQALGGLLPDLSGRDPGLDYIVNTGETTAKYLAEHPGASGERLAVTSAVPIVGPALAALADPSVSYDEGFAPTHEQNVAAVGAGIGLGTIIAGPKIIKMGKALSRLRAAPEAPTVTPREVPVTGNAITDQNVRTQALIEATNQRATTVTDAAGAESFRNRPSTVVPLVPRSVLPQTSDSEFGSALRTLHTGERDVRIAEANNLALDIRKALPDHVDREALTLMRDFRNNPAQLEAFASGMDPAYDGMPSDEKAGVLDQMKKLAPAMERALNPTDAMKEADAKLTDYFTKTLQEGRDIGFLDSNIAPEDYVNHLLLPADTEVGTEPRIGPSGVNRYTPFAKGRFYPTVLDAVAAGAKVRTLDAADALSIYGDKHGTAAATHVLIATLKDGDIGKFATDSTAPMGWKEVGPGTRLFRNEVPYADADGKPQVAHQALYAPKDIADALRPLTDPDYSSTIPGFTATKLYQQYVKSVELGLSVFHIRALNLSALGNEGLSGLVKSYAADMASPAFREIESTLLRHGGTTSITGRTFEAYRAARVTSLPTRLDVVRNLPVFKQFDQVAAATSHLTFDVMQRKFKVTDFGIKDAKWIAEHMANGDHLTPGWERQLAKARRGIAKEVNAVYGGLNWEALGVNKLTRSAARAFFLAPDWTFSNWQNAKTVFTGGPGGAAARAFWLRSAVTGVALTQLTSLLLSGKKSDDPTQVYMGQDHHGNDVYQNLYFAGAPSDMIGLVKNVQDSGAFIGTARSVAAKLAPVTRTGVQLLVNRNYLGQEIAKRGSGEAGDVRAAAHIATQLLPVPFSVSNVVQMEASNIASGQQPATATIKKIAKMLGDPTKDYTPTEFLTTAVGGQSPRHIPHWKRVRAQRK